jgi:hypothetical protein
MRKRSTFISYKIEYVFSSGGCKQKEIKTAPLGNNKSKIEYLSYGAGLLKTLVLHSG